MEVRRIRSTGLFIGLLVAAFVVGREARAGFARLRRAPAVPDEARPVAGRQLLFVYIGSSRCGPSNQPELLAAVGKSIGDIRSRATRASLGFVTIGVGRELNATTALGHLSKIATFDEVAVGQGDFNQASIRFISRDHPGIGATPQVLVVERVLSALGTTVDNVDFSERVLVRKVGAADIIRWVQRGSPITSEVWTDNHLVGGLP